MTTALQEVFARFTTQFDDSELARGAESTNTLTDRLRGLGLALGAGAIVAGVRSFIDGVREIGDELDKTSRVLGISSRELQAWRHAAELGGVSGAEFSGALIRLQRNALDASQGLQTSARIFDRLGVSVTDASGELKDAGTLLTELADPIAAIESPTERVGVLTTILGRQGARLGPLFERGAEGIEEARRELERLGGGVSEEAIEAAAELTDAQARLDLAMLSLRSRIGLVLLPIVERFTVGVTDLVAVFNDWIGESRLVEAALIVLGIAAVEAGSAVFASWVAAALPFIAIGALILGLILIVEDLIVAFEGGDSAIARLIDTVAGAGTSTAIINDLKNAWEGLVLFMERAAEAAEFIFGEGRFSGETSLQSFERIVRGQRSPEEEEQRLQEGLARQRAFRERQQTLQRGEAFLEPTPARGRPAPIVVPAAPTTQTVNNQVQVNVAQASSDVQVERAVTRALDRANRETEDALSQEAAQ